MLASATLQFIVFSLGGERFAVPIADVQEVIDAPSVRPVPDAAPSVLGMTTIGGHPTVVYDPRSALRVGGRIGGAALLFIRGERRVAVAVDDVHDAVSISSDEIRRSPIAGAGAAGVIGVVRTGAELVAVIDSATLLDAMMQPTDESTRGETKRT